MILLSSGGFYPIKPQLLSAHVVIFKFFDYNFLDVFLLNDTTD